VSLTIRPLLRDDLEGCLRVINSLPRFFAVEEGVPQGVGRDAADLSSNGGLVAVAAQRIIGFVTWKRHLPGAAEISWMAVHDSLRHRGIGTALLGRMESVLVSQGYRQLSLLTSASSHTYEPTRRFWEGRGFTPILALDGLWDTDVAVIYTRTLCR
jgi:GNAT superfamily N-acetyltransferase